jgi:hypothetical protein
VVLHRIYGHHVHRTLFDAQVHKAISPDPDGLVQMGQLLALKVDDFGSIYGNSGAKDGHDDDRGGNS